MTSLANSHIEANAPKGELFDKYLQRDLTAYFCNDAKDCRVEFDYLRNGATQSGASYPKYYLWAKCFVKAQLKTEGAVRIEAVDQKSFHVTDFLPAKEIAASPNRVVSVFPAALVDKVLERAKH